ncbi:uncharacterized protein C3orf85 homolog [Hirundo rustica]|uniref:uncharacterized protein C3orf85 homolog n=1 Tax=Hirundo rustica TaxID=43150 RepID=UPI001A9467F7|nr:uncharacterized protein C3orf85 homolog [Hirundo rustica]
MAAGTDRRMGVLGAPFLAEESATQFIRLKRHIPYSPSYWDSSSSQNTWGNTLAEQISESWAALRETAQYYMDLDPFAFNPSTAIINIRSYMELLQLSGTHLQQQALNPTHLVSGCVRMWHVMYLPLCI